MKKQIILYIFLFFSLLASSQTDKEMQLLRQGRYQRVYSHHLGIGMESNMLENFRLSPRLFYSFCSYRSYFSIDAGVKYVYSHPMVPLTQERLACHYLAPLLSVKAHFWHWDKGCLYAGGEAAYHLALVGEHYIPGNDLPIRDRKIGKHHASVRAQFGVKMEHWELNVHYEYDLNPSWNQKYLFESAEYNYDLLRPSLYERHRVGITLAYLITFRQ